MKIPCPKCGCKRPLDVVHGHYQCADCKCVIEDCCQGEVAQPESPDKC